MLVECRHPAGLDPDPLWEQEEHRGFEDALKKCPRKKVSGPSHTPWPVATARP